MTTKIAFHGSKSFQVQTKESEYGPLHQVKIIRDRSKFLLTQKMLVELREILRLAEMEGAKLMGEKVIG